MVVCRTDGVPVALARSGRWVHTDAVPKGVPEHEVAPVEASDYGDGAERRASLRDAAGDMLQHHATLHPASDCEWAARLRAALR